MFDRKHLFVALIAPLAVAVFALDISLRLGFVAAVPYVVVVALATWLCAPEETLFITFACTAFNLIGCCFLPVEGQPWMIVGNRLLAVLATWVILIAARLSARSTKPLSSGDGGSSSCEFDLAGAEDDTHYDVKTQTALCHDDFVRDLNDLGLISTDRLEAFLDQYPTNDNPASVRELAHDLVEEGLLTRYQATRIYRGRSKDLALGDYFVVDKLGRGGVGIVLKARHRTSGEVYAVKRLLARTSEEHLRRFLREADVATQLHHPNIVRAYYAGHANGHPYLVMEFVDGWDLHRYVDNRGQLDIDEGLDYVIQAARALEYAHGLGVIHRDVKPSNLLLNSRGIIKIADMGLARFVDHAVSSAGLGSRQAEQVTETDAVLGSVSFMAPEQALDYHRTDHRADIYGLGCAMYYLLTGQSNLPGTTRGEMLKSLFDPRTPARSLSENRDHIPAPLEAIYQCMVAKTVEQRYQCMGDVVTDLMACTDTVCANS